MGRLQSRHIFRERKRNTRDVFAEYETNAGRIFLERGDKLESTKTCDDKQQQHAPNSTRNHEHEIEDATRPPPRAPGRLPTRLAGESRR